MRKLLWTLLFASLTAVATFIPLTLPYTWVLGPPGLPGAQEWFHWHLLSAGTFIDSAQILMVWLSGLLLGAELGAASQVFYLGMGLFLAPVFGHGGGRAYMHQPTFGYLLGFVPAAYLAGRFRGGIRRTAWGLLFGQLALDACGVTFQLGSARAGIIAWWPAFWTTCHLFAVQLFLMIAVALLFGSCHHLWQATRLRWASVNPA